MTSKKYLWLIILSITLMASLEAKLLEDFFFPKPEAKVPPMIKVLLFQDRPGALLETKGKYHLYDPLDNSFLSTRFIGKRKYIQAVVDGLQWAEEFPGLYQLMIVPDKQAITTLVDGIEYRGSIYVYNVEGLISVVNEVYLEDYIKSILSSQSNAPLSEEVLASLAIIARTEALDQALHPKNMYWAVDAQEVGYHGYAVTGEDPAIQRAVDRSRHLVLIDQAKKSLLAIVDKDSSQMGKLTIGQAEKLAEKGSTAVEILSQAFPSAKLALDHGPAIDESMAKR